MIVIIINNNAGIRATLQAVMAWLSSILFILYATLQIGTSQNFVCIINYNCKNMINMVNIYFSNSV